jgi:hypothetical protein
LKEIKTGNFSDFGMIRSSSKISIFIVTTGQKHYPSSWRKRMGKELEKEDPCAKLLQVAKEAGADIGSGYFANKPRPRFSFERPTGRVRRDEKPAETPSPSFT